MKIGVNVKEQHFIVVLHFTFAEGSVTMNINLAPKRYIFASLSFRCHLMNRIYFLDINKKTKYM